MGIPHFFPWINARYGRHVRANLKSFPHVKRIRGFYVDGNSVIHKAHQYVKGYGKYTVPQADSSDTAVYERVIYLLEEAITLVNPTLDFILAMDGVVPVAKLYQQRVRRFKKSSTEDETLQDQDIVDKTATTTSDPNVISPGTAFMDGLDVRVRKWLKDNIGKLPNSITYYPHRLPGEGEHKLFNAMNAVKGEFRGISMKQVAGKTIAPHYDSHTVVYGEDADLIVLALLRGKNTIIMRENITPAESPFIFVDIDNISRDIHSKTGMENMGDFLFITFLLGNDFVPTVPSAFDVYGILDYCLDLYPLVREQVMKDKKRTKSGFSLLTIDGLQVEDVRLFLLQLALNEPSLIKARGRAEKGLDSRKYQPVPTTAIMDAMVHDPKSNTWGLDFEGYRTYYYLGKKDSYNGIAVPITGADYVVDPILGTTAGEEANSVIRDMCDAWFEAVEWMGAYYYGGGGVNVGWYYRYYYAPLVTDLKGRMVEMKGKESIWRKVPIHEKTQYMTPLEQLIAILPKDSLSRILYGVAEPPPTLVSKVFVPLVDLYPQGWVKDMEGRTKAYQTLYILPKVSIERIIPIAEGINRRDIDRVERTPVTYPPQK